MLLYIVQYFINSVDSLEILSDIMLCVCVTHFAKGRKKLCRQTAQSLIGARGSVPVKTKTCLQVWSMYVPGFCSWSLWLRLAVCFQYLFLCNYRLAMLKGALHAGRRSALVFSREFVWCYSPFSLFSCSTCGSLSESCLLMVFMSLWPFSLCKWKFVQKKRLGVN